jgi:hypothetical protein
MIIMTRTNLCEDKHVAEGEGADRGRAHAVVFEQRDFAKRSALGERRQDAATAKHQNFATHQKIHLRAHVALLTKNACIRAMCMCISRACACGCAYKCMCGERVFSQNLLECMHACKSHSFLSIPVRAAAQQRTAAANVQERGGARACMRMRACVCVHDEPTQPTLRTSLMRKSPGAWISGVKEAVSSWMKAGCECANSGILRTMSKLKI